MPRNINFLGIRRGYEPFYWDHVGSYESYENKWRSYGIAQK
jgi:hypothetical protein